MTDPTAVTEVLPPSSIAPWALALDAMHKAAAITTATRADDLFTLIQPSSPNGSSEWTDSGSTFFGAYWCPHCSEQKKLFGSSFKNVDYVECSLPNRAGQTRVCNEAGITGYPTWEFGDGTRASGALPLEILSIRSGCSLDTNVA